MQEDLLRPLYNPNLPPLRLCTPSDQPSPGPLLRVLYFLRVPSLFGESFKVSSQKGPELLQVTWPSDK